ncbi:LytS/YhcK type 5TM receptor domain-containing protein [Bacillaceae bacterium IKA-2]|nr:LytS/YhcK type 5TM receptor domain-containing protein [Bacillaceae bacterium IKA-2]
MWELLLLMLERLGIIVTVAFIMTRFKFVRNVIDQKKVSKLQWIAFITFFGLFGIIGTYTGITVSPENVTYTRWTIPLAEEEGIANSRVIGIVIAGLLGGWKAGLGAGIIAGGHRYLLGGFTAFACGISTIIAGVVAGYFYKKHHHKRIISLQTAFYVGALAEAIQMVIIVLVARPFDHALALVQSIGVPMIIANGIGVGIFILIIKNVVNEEEKIGSSQAQKAFNLADLTLKYLRKGLTPESSKATCAILLKEVNVVAVSITNRKEILAYEGLATEQHVISKEIKTNATKQVLNTGELLITKNEELQKTGYDKRIKAAIIAPLKRDEETIGTLKFYFQSEKELSPMVIELIKGLSSLLSHQLELAEVDRHQQLAQQSEIKALQAQVNPHFLFNAINTIVSLTRIDPNKARRLLLSLSNYFRQNLYGVNRLWNTLEIELNHVKSYLEIEQARFANKLSVRYDVCPEALMIKVPTLTLQPLVENAVKHGIMSLNENGEITILIKKDDRGMIVSIEDNGVGIGEEKFRLLKQNQIESDTGTGIGIYNVNRRLQMLVGEEAELTIKTREGKGTTISFFIPTKAEGAIEEHEKN